MLVLLVKGDITMLHNMEEHEKYFDLIGVHVTTCYGKTGKVILQSVMIW